MTERLWKQALENHLLLTYTRVRDVVNLLHILNWKVGAGSSEGWRHMFEESWSENESKRHRRRRNKSVVI